MHHKPDFAISTAHHETEPMQHQEIAKAREETDLFNFAHIFLRNL